MDCREIKQNLSSYLDGQLSSEETLMIQTHLSNCAACRREYNQLVALVNALKKVGTEVIPAPDGFKASVMQQIIDSRSFSRLEQVRNVITRWKPAVAATAAALLITLGGLGVRFMPAFQTAHNNRADQPQVIVADKGDSINNDKTSSNNNLSPSHAAAPSQPQKVENSNTPDPAITTTPGVNQVPDQPMHSSPIFLNKERVVKTTMLKLKVVDPAAALEQATQIAGTSGASTQNLGQQVNENGTFWVLKITGTKAAAPNLLASLSSLGTVSGQDVDKVDITSQYAQNLSKYQALTAERDRVQDAAQKAQIDGQITKLEGELKSLEASAEKETIILWLQK
ncbi:MAG: zf-HC2 domain-containing protein [Syntrophomonadaceae bacterium]|jgi:hypothetical protein